MMTCKECDSDKVQWLVWQECNTDKVVALAGMGLDGQWCPECGKFVLLKEQEDE